VCKIEKEIPKYSFFFFLSLGETRRMTPQITTGTFLLPWRRGYFFFFFHPPDPAAEILLLENWANCIAQLIRFLYSMGRKYVIYIRNG
jgi:hypothetical protein